MRVVPSRLGFVIALLVLSSAGAGAQWRSNSLALGAPSREYARPAPVLPGGENVFSPDQASVFVSAFLGLNHNTNMGNFRTDCDCDFEGTFGLGNLGALLGVDVTYQFHPSWAVMMKVFYDNKHTKESYERALQTPISANQQVVVREVLFEEEGTVSLAYTTIGLYGRWQPRLARWYVFAGPTIGVPIATSLDHNQSIVTPELTYNDVSLSNRDYAVSTADFEGLLRIEGMVGFGYDYIIAPRWFINPEIRVGFPLNNVTNTVNDRGKTIDIPDWKVMSMQFSIGLKYEAF